MRRSAIAAAVLGTSLLFIAPAGITAAAPPPTHSSSAATTPAETPPVKQLSTTEHYRQFEGTGITPDASKSSAYDLVRAHDCFVEKAETRSHPGAGRDVFVTTVHATCPP
jgi:hypothetical protein